MASNFFEDYVNKELPTKLGTSMPSHEITEGLVPVSTGLGLGFDLVQAKDIPGLVSKSAFDSAVEAGYEGTEEEFYLDLISPKGKGGGVFIVDVLPQGSGDNTGDKVMSADNFSVKSFTSTTNKLIVKLVGVTGSTNYRPVITVNGVEASMIQKSDAPMWDGTATVEVEANGDSELIIEALHEDGASSVAVGIMDSAPVITAARFTGTYPGTQTELKADDVMSISFASDQDVIGYEIRDLGALVAASGSLTSGKTHALANLKIANRGNATASHGFSIRVRKASGAWSAWYRTDTVGSVELQHVVKLNNQFPVITVNSVVYPVGSDSIKTGETATVKHVITNADSYNYISPNSTVSISNSTVYATDKVVNYLSGAYNDATENLNIRATKTSNNAVTNKGVIVRIANVAPVVNITLPVARLRSGGNNGTAIQKHVITLTSNQSLAKTPTLNAPEGTWEVTDWKPNATRKVWTRSLQVHDSAAKGTFTFNTLKVENGAGLTQTAIGSGADYVLGGFVFRTLTIAAYPNRSGIIGTEVVNTAKLRCSNLSKGSSGSLNFTYQATDTDAVNKYTIKSNNLWYNCDAPNSTSNTSGLMTVELEEVV